MLISHCNDTTDTLNLNLATRFICSALDGYYNDNTRFIYYYSQNPIDINTKFALLRPVQNQVSKAWTRTHPI